MKVEKRITMDKHPLLKIWLSPRETIRYILSTKPNYLVYILAILWGIVFILDRTSSKNMGDQHELVAIFGGAIIVGAFLGIFRLYFAAFTTKLAGSLLGGKATFKELRTAIAWAEVPFVTSLVLIVLQSILFGKEYFSSETIIIESSLFLHIIYIAFMIFEIVLAFWTSVLYVIILSEVQKFGILKAIANFFLVVVVVLVPVLIISFLLRG